MYAQPLIVYLTMSGWFCSCSRSHIPETTSLSMNFFWTYGNLKMIDISLETCLLAYREQSSWNSRQLKAISIRSLLSSRCWLAAFVKMTMKDLMRESRRWMSIFSVSFGSMLSTSIYSSFLDSLDSSLKKSSWALLRWLPPLLNTASLEEEPFDFDALGIVLASFRDREVFTRPVSLWPI